MAKNEFECVHVKRFTQPDIVQFTEAVDATHGIYEHRCANVVLCDMLALCSVLLMQYACCEKGHA